MSDGRQASLRIIAESVQTFKRHVTTLKLPLVVLLQQECVDEANERDIRISKSLKPHKLGRQWRCLLLVHIRESSGNGGKLEIAQQMANHESARTTGLYDRRLDQVSLDEVERIRI